MATIQTLKHGEPNWDTKANANFQALASAMTSSMGRKGAGDYRTTTSIVGMNGASPRTSDAWVRIYEVGNIAILKWNVHVDNVTTWKSGEIKAVFAIEDSWIGKWFSADSLQVGNFPVLDKTGLSYSTWLDSASNPGVVDLRFWGDTSTLTAGMPVEGFTILSY